MKTKLFTLFLMLATSIGSLIASHSKVNGIWYDFYDSNNTASVAVSPYYDKYSGYIVIPSSVAYNNKTYSVTSIGSRAFETCTGLTSVEMPNSVTSIGSYAFCSCTGLTSIEIPNSVTSIGTNAFVFCSSLTSITIPSSVTIIENSAFHCCTGLTSINVDAANLNYYSMDGVLYNKTLSMLIWYPCGKQGTSYTIPNSVTSIGSRAFDQCTSLTSVEMPNSVISIGSRAFSSCTGLTSVFIPNSITSIGSYAFSDCTSLTSITIENSNSPSIGEDAFYNCSRDLIISVPCNSLEAYQTAWSDYASLIQCNRMFSIELLVNDSIAGSVDKTIYNDSLASIEATPNYGYHFVQWSDGNITNPRTIELTQDTSFTAIFAKNTYAVTTAANNAEWGTTTGDAYVLYQEQSVIQAMPNYGYHFVRWNDGNNSNPRSVVVTQDTTYTATFAKNQYSITKISDLSQGSISGLSRAEYLDTVTLEAMPEYGYKFLRWSDGIKDNPRTFVLTQDTTFAAEFGYTVAGSCGDNNQLTWTFDSISGTLSISGEGTLGSNYTYGLQAPAQTTRLIIEEGVTSIGDYAFNGMGSTITSLALPTTLTNIGNYAFAGFNNRKFNSLVLPNDIIAIGAHAFDGASYLQTIYFGSLLEEIGASAFNGCTRVRQMTCLAEITPNVGTDGLTSISSLAELYVPNEYLFDYQIDTNWSRFVLKTIGATEATVTNNDVKVVADDNTATLTWPTSENADSYSIEITKDGVVFCTLVFNANGQLTGIAFAPSRNGQPHAPAATMTANGMQFTVTGLNSGTNYAFSVAAKNGETVLASYSGEFETTGAPAVATDLVNPSGIHDRYQKILRDGQIYILRGEKVYTLQGQEVK